MDYMISYFDEHYGIPVRRKVTGTLNDVRKVACKYLRSGFVTNSSGKGVDDGFADFDCLHVTVYLQKVCKENLVGYVIMGGNEFSWMCNFKGPVFDPEIGYYVPDFDEIIIDSESGGLTNVMLNSNGTRTKCECLEVE